MDKKQVQTINLIEIKVGSVYLIQNPFPGRRVTMRLLKMMLILVLIGCTACQELQLVPCNDTQCAQCDQNNTYCISCKEAFYLNNTNGTCQSCNIVDCTACSPNYKNQLTCDTCNGDLFPDFEGYSCKNCQNLIQNCSLCIQKESKKDRLKCGSCSADYSMSDDMFSCIQNSSTADTLKILAIGAGGLAVIGAGYAIFRCSRKKTGHHQLQEEMD